MSEEDKRGQIKQSFATKKFNNFDLDDCQTLFDDIERFIQKNDPTGLQEFLKKEVPDFVVANLVKLAYSTNFNLNFPENNQEQLLTELMRYAANNISLNEIGNILQETNEYYNSETSSGLTFETFKNIFLSLTVSEERISIIQHALQQFEPESDNFSITEDNEYKNKSLYSDETEYKISLERSDDEDETNERQLSRHQKQETDRSKYFYFKSSIFTNRPEDKEKSDYKYRHFEDFKNAGFVKVSSQTSALPQAQKIPKPEEDIKLKTEKYEKIWWPKKADSVDEAFKETVVGNFRALINTDGVYFKTRWTIDKDDVPYVFSENVPGFQTLFDIENQEEGLTKKKLLNRKFQGSGEFVVFNIFLEEIDAHIGNIAFGSNVHMMTVDNGACFWSLQPYGTRLDHYTDRDIASLPFLPNHEFAYFHNVMSDKKTNTGSFFDASFARNAFFLHEKNKTLLKILVLPRFFLADFIDCFANEKVTPERVIGLKEALAGIGKDKLFATIKSNSDFRKYILSESAADDLNIFMKHLANFKVPGKKYLIDLYPDLFEELKNKFNAYRNYFMEVSLQDLEDEKQKRGLWFHLDNFQTEEAEKIRLKLIENDDAIKAAKTLELADMSSEEGRKQKREEMLNIFELALDNNKPAIIATLLEEIMADNDADTIDVFIQEFNKSRKTEISRNLLDIASMRFMELAVSRGRIDLVDEQLEILPINTIINQKGQTALCLAAECGHLDIVRLLLQNNAEVNNPDLQGRTALATATINGHANIVNLLLEHNANPGLTDAKGRTPLSWAKELGLVGIEQLLTADNVMDQKLRPSSRTFPPSNSLGTPLETKPLTMTEPGSPREEYDRVNPAIDRFNTVEKDKQAPKEQEKKDKILIPAKQDRTAIQALIKRQQQQGYLDKPHTQEPVITIPTEYQTDTRENNLQQQN